MRIIEMSTRSDLSLSAALAALGQLHGLTGSALGDALADGRDFIELQFAPDLESVETAIVVGKALTGMGVGVALRVHWPFKGTRAWAIQTENVRVTNRGA